MKPSGIVLLLILLLSSFSVIIPSVYSTSSPITLDGTMNPDEQWTFWHSDSTYDFVGYRHFEQETNKLAYEAYVCTTDPDSLCVFISTNDNSFDFSHRDKFSIYFDVYPYGRGEEDVAYEIEVPSFWYGGGIKKHGPHWWSLDNYQNIIAGSTNGYRTYELHIPLSDIALDTEDENYRRPRFMIYLENYGSVKWRAQKLNNYHPDDVEHSKWWKHTDLWEEIDLKSWYPTLWGGSQEEYSLTANVLGNGLVSVNVTGPYSFDDTVELKAVPDAGWSFSNWTGDISGSTNPQVVTIENNMTITANFVQNNYTLTTDSVGNGNVTVSPNNVTYSYGDVIEVSAFPLTGWSFSGWSGDISESSNPVLVVMDGNKTVLATFIQNEYSLTLDVVGEGSITKNPNNSTYHYGDTVELVASPEAGYTFSEWTGDVSGSSNPISVVMDENKTATATFVQSMYSLTVSSNPSLGGTVILNNTGPYYYGDAIELIATPEPGWSFIGWNGDLAGSTNPNVIVMDVNKTVQAMFSQIEYTLTTTMVGSGYVNKNPNKLTYHYGDSVSLYAGISTLGWKFSEWSGDVSNTSKLINIIITNNTNIVATFVQVEYTLDITIVGNGTVTKSPDKLTYFYGEEVTLTANASDVWIFYQFIVPSANGYQNQGVYYSNPTTFKVGVNIVAVFVENKSTLSLSPNLIVGSPPDLGDTFDVTLNVENVTNLWAWKVQISWDEEVLELVNVKEENFLSDVASTLFVHTAIQPGLLDEMVCVFLSTSGANGSGNLATLTFNVVGYGNTDIEITESIMFETPIVFDGAFKAYPEFPYTVSNSPFELVPPPAHAPDAVFSPNDDEWYYEGDLITLDAGSSIPGYDTVPSAIICPITSYVWELDFGNNGSVDETLYGETVSFVGTYVGDVSIKLIVTALDVAAPSDSGYQETDSETHIVHVTERPTMANIDVYTERGGQFAEVRSDAYGPQELVTIYANVTYNDVAVVGKDVSFQIIDNQGNVIAYRTARTDDDGVATIEYRLPWLDYGSPEALFGNWTITAAVDISELVVEDICEFTFNYIIEIIDTELIDILNNQTSSVTRTDFLNLNATVSNIRDIAVDTIVTISIFDECEVPIGCATVHISIPERSTQELSLGINVPSWAFVGQAIVYFETFNEIPQLGGMPYSPETQKLFMIQE